jgi:hypothetical protein
VKIEEEEAEEDDSIRHNVLLLHVTKMFSYLENNFGKLTELSSELC